MFLHIFLGWARFFYLHFTVNILKVISDYLTKPSWRSAKELADFVLQSEDRRKRRHQQQHVKSAGGAVSCRQFNNYEKRWRNKQII